jgi:hypothetical protein
LDRVVVLAARGAVEHAEQNVLVRSAGAMPVGGQTLAVVHDERTMSGVVRRKGIAQQRSLRAGRRGEDLVQLAPLARIERDRAGPAGGGDRSADGDTRADVLYVCRAPAQKRRCERRP